MKDEFVTLNWLIGAVLVGWVLTAMLNSSEATLRQRIVELEARMCLPDKRAGVPRDPYGRILNIEPTYRGSAGVTPQEGK